jgi:hypothetical protein
MHMTKSVKHPMRKGVLEAAVAATAAVAMSAAGSTASAAEHAAPLGWGKPKRVAELTVPGSDELGFAAALSGSGKVAVVGTIGEVVFVFTKSGDGWVQAATLSAAEGAQGDEFGADVAVSDDGSNDSRRRSAA